MALVSSGGAAAVGDVVGRRETWAGRWRRRAGRWRTWAGRRVKDPEFQQGAEPSERDDLGREEAERHGRGGGGRGRGGANNFMTCRNKVCRLSGFLGQGLLASWTAGSTCVGFMDVSASSIAVNVGFMNCCNKVCRILNE
jgi:hypothetical protein